MSQADLDINRAVRTVLVKHWIDLGRISVRSSDGKLWVRGSLSRIAGVNEELTPQIVEAMSDEMRRIRNIKQIYFSLENWNNDSGAWHEVGKKRQQQQQQITPPVKTVYDIESEQGDN